LSALRLILGIAAGYGVSWAMGLGSTVLAFLTLPLLLLNVM
jgi:hypothetical protein